MKVIRESGVVLFTKIMSNPANGQIHLAESPCVRITFLSKYGDFLSVAIMLVHELQ